MEWQVIVALAVAVPIMVLPVVLTWYLTLGGAVATVREARRGRTGEARKAETVVR